ncbi:MAG: cca [Clostridiaceae bacterium]|jgi:tRNA nucleotidyltransferase (CCA-adding enzyme)|nr:cca [Clostridiaceae bacterium]
MKEKEILLKIANDIDKIGGKVFYVGGYVRDLFTNKPNKDIDVEIYGISVPDFLNILSKYGIVDKVGASFGIFMIHGLDIDFALPRKEIKANVNHELKLVKIPHKYVLNYILQIKSSYPDYEVIIEEKHKFGHKDFIVIYDTFMSFEESTRRRDFTCNGMMKDVLSGEVIDLWGGIKDIENRCIRHIDSQTFIEDSLRVFRACQFASRFEFTVCKETLNLCRNIDLTNLSKERIYEEIKKSLLKSDKPSIAFEVMREMGVIKSTFPELYEMINCPQNPKYHPEGDVWNHTMLVLDKASKLKDSSLDSEIFMLSALLHDIGKPKSTQIIDDKITSNGHEKIGVEIAKSLLERITNDKRIIEGVLNIIENHMIPVSLFNGKASDKAIRKFSLKTNIDNILLFMQADFSGKAEQEKEINEILMWFKSKLVETGADKEIKPIITGKDLINMGLIPGKEFGVILNKAFDLQLDGLDRQQIISNFFDYSEILYYNRKGHEINMLTIKHK